MTNTAFYKTVKDLQAKIDEYFNVYCKDEVVKDKNGKPCVNTRGALYIKYKPPTCSGLALYLGFADRQSLYDYKKNEKYSCTIKKAISRIVEYAETQLFIGNSTGAIFWLKNRDDWNDKVVNENYNRNLDVDTPPSETREEWVKRQKEKDAKTN
jgi:hypothetical protein